MRRALLILAIATASAVGASHVALRLRDEADAPKAPLEAAALRRAVHAPPPTPSGDASVSKGADGHFWAEAQVQGRHVRFLVDTGASTVALTAADATRLGVNVRALRFDQPVSTANGQTMGALLTLDYVSVAGARIEDVEALVLADGLDDSLLGMTYLGRLSRFEATRNTLILRR